MVQCISIFDCVPKRTALLFFAVDGAQFPDIPCRVQVLKARAKIKQTEPARKNMKQLLKLTAAPATALFATAFIAMATPAAAGHNEYCRQDVTSAMRSCGFDSLAHCQAISAGRGGDCYRDPFLANSSDALAYQPKHHSKNARKPV